MTVLVIDGRIGGTAAILTNEQSKIRHRTVATAIDANQDIFSGLMARTPTDKVC